MKKSGQWNKKTNEGRERRRSGRNTQTKQKVDVSETKDGASERERERAETESKNKLWPQPPEKVFRGESRCGRRRTDPVSLRLLPLLLVPP